MGSIDERVIQAKPVVEGIGTVELFEFLKRDRFSLPEFGFVLFTDQKTIENDTQVSFVNV